MIHGLFITVLHMGRYIVEYEQNGKEHAEYGLELLKKLAKDLTLRKGKGYSRPNLYNMRRFYLRYPNGFKNLEGLTWSHFCELITIEDDLERQFYEKECIAQKWNVRTLKMQKEIHGEPAFLFGLHAVFYQIELSRVRVGVEFQSFMLPSNPSNVIIDLVILVTIRIEKQCLFHD